MDNLAIVPRWKLAGRIGSCLHMLSIIIIIATAPISTEPEIWTIIVCWLLYTPGARWTASISTRAWSLIGIRARAVACTRKDHIFLSIRCVSASCFRPPVIYLLRVVRIPKHAVLSTKNCTLSPYIPASPYGPGAQLALSLALYTEM